MDRLESEDAKAFTDGFGRICAGSPSHAHSWHPHTQRQYWLNVGDGLGPGYAVHAEHHTEHKVMSVYCQHCLEVRAI